MPSDGRSSATHQSDILSPAVTGGNDPRAASRREAIAPALSAKASPDSYCPVCGSSLVAEKCKVVCRSAACIYRIVFNCSEF